MIKGIPCAFGWDAKYCDETLISYELGKGLYSAFSPAFELAMMIQGTPAWKSFEIMSAYV